MYFFEQLFIFIFSLIYFALGIAIILIAITAMVYIILACRRYLHNNPKKNIANELLKK